MTTPPSDNSEQPTGQAMSSSAAAAVQHSVRDGLPLAVGLRAYSEEISSPSLRRTLVRIADDLAAGHPLESVVSRHRNEFPETVAAIIEAGIRTGRLSVMLEEYLVAEQHSRNSRRRLWQALLYPAVLAVLLGFLVCVFATWCLPQFRSLYEDFGVPLPTLTLFYLDLGQGINALIHHWVAVSAILVILIVGQRFLLPRTWYRRILYEIPIIGSALKDSAAANYCRTLALLIEGRMSLPEAFQMMSRATPAPALRNASRQLATRIASGESLTEAVADLYDFPPSIRTLFRWEQNDTALIQGLRSTSDLHDAHADTNTGMIAVIAEPALLITLGLTVGFGVIALFLPMIRLLNELIPLSSLPPRESGGSLESLLPLLAFGLVTIIIIVSTWWLKTYRTAPSRPLTWLIRTCLVAVCVLVPIIGIALVLVYSLVLVFSRRRSRQARLL